ncbi:Fc.00g036370.m01.CDS01 [Cosmosporella sp. VM-42]
MPTDLFVGIDFGTTHTGATYRSSQWGGTPITIHDWPTDQLADRNKIINPKVPSKIHFHPDQGITWGFGVPRDGTALEWCKLSLLHRDNLPQCVRISSIYNKNVATQDGLNKSAYEVTAAFLREFWQYIWSQIQHDVVRKNERPDLHLHLVMTVPAMWPIDAMQRFKSTIDAAGILNGSYKGDLMFLSEPEATAIHLLSLTTSSNPFLKIGDLVIILDCGGGTLDSIAYQVSRVTPMVVLDECVPEECRLGGGTFIEDAVLKLFKSKIQALVPARTYSRIPEHEIRAFIQQEWEYNLKLLFTDDEDDDDDEWLFSLPLKWAGSNIRRARLDVKEKKGREPEYIFLGGGLGCNKYVKNTLTARMPGPTRVICFPGNQAWSAVSEGSAKYAVRQYRQNTVQVASRVSRASYGIQTGDNMIEWFVKRTATLCAVQVYRTDNSNSTHYLCSIKWTIEDLSNIAGASQLGVTSCGDAINFDVYHNNILQGKDKVTVDFGHQGIGG